MAGNALIGALKVSLGLDSAQFNNGLKAAQGDLGRFGKLVGVSLAGVAAAAAGVATAMAIAVKGSIDHADALSKTAQKAGVATEALSRLEFAAKLSDLSLDQLAGGLQKLSRNMVDVATGSTGPAAAAFAALGIGVKDAAGNIRASEDVFAEVADRFVRMEDGATKTALAIQLFGKSGADLIPLLNSGRDGLKAMADESDRLGLTISTKTGRAAEQFNDTLTRVGAILEGVTTKVMAGALPALQRVADTLASPQVAQAAAAFANGILTAFDLIIQGAALVINAIDSIGKHMEQQKGQIGFGGTVFGDVFGFGGGTPKTPAMDDTGAGASFGDLAAFNPPALPDVKPFTADLNALSTATNAAKASQDALKDAMAEGISVFEATRTPLETAQMEFDKLGNLLNKGAIDWETYGRAVDAVRMNTAASVIGMAGQITSSLAGLFKDNKAFAVASAVINTAEGVTKALAQGGIWGLAGAAAVAASGAAQIASILSANPGSGSVKQPTSTAAAQTPVAPADVGGGRAINLTLEGGGRYSRNELEALFRDMNDAMGDGFKLNVNPA
jgi:hypothetical protein